MNNEQILQSKMINKTTSLGGIAGYVVMVSTCLKMPPGNNPKTLTLITNALRSKPEIFRPEISSRNKGSNQKQDYPTTL